MNGLIRQVLEQNLNNSTGGISPLLSEALFSNPQPSMSTGLAQIGNTAVHNINPIDRLAKYEGYRSHVYKDSKGYDTIGYGYKLKDGEQAKFKNGLSQEAAKNLLQQTYQSHINKFYQQNPNLQNLPNNKRIALEDMAYNMGPSYLQKFPKANQALQAGDYNKAANEFLHSKYANEVGQRAIDNANLLRE